MEKTTSARMSKSVEDLEPIEIIQLTIELQSDYDARNVHTVLHKHTREVMMNISVPVYENIEELTDDGWVLANGVAMA